MFKNEAPKLKEWIEYHRLIGVEHFYLYNNDSTDDYQEVLTPYISAGIVDLIPWESQLAPFHDPRQPVHWVGFQLSAFNHCIEHCVGLAKWVALIDVDEFLLPMKGPKEGVEELHRLLETASSDIGSFFFSWRNFGTSRIYKLSDGDLATERFLMRAKDNHQTNVHFKCLHRPEAVDYTLVHEAFLKPGYKREYIDPKNIRINHYYLYDRKTCLTKRCDEDRYRLKLLESEFNQIYDKTMLLFTPLINRS